MGETIAREYVDPLPITIIRPATVSERAAGEIYFLTDGVVHSWWDVAQVIAGE